MAATSNEDIVSRYFDEVQQKIKKLISEDKNIKQSQIQEFNDEIFNQPDDIKTEIHTYIDKATMNDLDLDKVAKIIYDRFKTQVNNNLNNQTDNQNVPNPMLGERKNVMTFEKFKNMKK